MLSTKTTQSEPKSLREIKRSWVELFDNQTTPEAKEIIRRDFINGINATAPKEFGKDFFSRLPKGTITTIIMGGGYDFGRKVFSHLRDMSISDTFVLIGYSSGVQSRDKKFSNGDMMAGRLYIPLDNLNVLRNNPSAPILLTDDMVETGITMAIVGNTLRSFGHTGNLYQITENDINLNKKSSVYYWDGKILDNKYIVKITKDNKMRSVLAERRRLKSFFAQRSEIMPISTEYGQLFKSSVR